METGTTYDNEAFIAQVLQVGGLDFNPRCLHFHLCELGKFCYLF